MKLLTKNWVLSLQKALLPEATKNEKEGLKTLLLELEKVNETNSKSEKLIDKNFKMRKYYFQQITNVEKTDCELKFTFKSEKALTFTKYKVINDQLNLTCGKIGAFVELHFAELYNDHGLFEAHFLVHSPSATPKSDLYDFIIVADSIRIEK
ncbi:MAG: hypothetical protein IJX03_04590 [Clostridia bacterium]|nr:hypothetical protein [Clostridia bacterium]